MSKIINLLFDFLKLFIITMILINYKVNLYKKLVEFFKLIIILSIERFIFTICNSDDKRR